MNILVIGSGGREHALVSKLLQSEDVGTIYCCPGNGGMKFPGVSRIAIEDYDELASFSQKNNVGLVVVGPEKPLCEGIVDLFRKKGLKIFGPGKKAAKLEGSKWFAKQFMQRNGIPTAEAKSFKDFNAAQEHVRSRGAPIVIKADGLASGKGVTVAHTEESAIDAIAKCFNGAFGEAGSEVILEECLIGEEASILAFLDQNVIKPLVSSQDHKRLEENDQGPNTGGMGAYSPAPVVERGQWPEIHEKILTPFLKGCQQEGLDYRGIIYAGLMFTETGPKVLEFNVRFGDPETQAILPRLKSDLAKAMLFTIDDRLSDYDFEWSDDVAVCVVLASEGYPGKPKIGYPIKGIEAAESSGAMVFHAGTKNQGSQFITSGGRVLGVTSCAHSIKEASENAYQAIDKISWPGLYCRRDIAAKAITCR